MNIQQELQLKLSHSSLRDAALLMGYNKVNAARAIARIGNVLSDPQLGLFTGKYDFKYSNEEFLIALCAVFGINIDEHLHELNTITNGDSDSSEKFKPYVFIDTNFKRESQPIYILSLCEEQRRLHLDYEVRTKPIHKQVEYIQRLVKQHYDNCDGSLKIWGNIQRYVYFYAEGCKLAISPDGVILNDPEVVNISRATVTVGGVYVTHPFISIPTLK